MSLNELYQEVILDHSKRPRNFGNLAEANRTAEGYNPLCGDRLTLYLKMKDDVIEDIRFEGSGCAISTASESLMTERLKGRTRQEAEALFDKFHALVTEEHPDLEAGPPLDKLEVLAGVREFPMRVKCATLGWHTLKNALESTATTAVTE